MQKCVFVKNERVYVWIVMCGIVTSAREKESIGVCESECVCAGERERANERERESVWMCVSVFICLKTRKRGKQREERERLCMREGDYERGDSGDKLSPMKAAEQSFKT